MFTSGIVLLRAGTVKDDVVGASNIADYLLFLLNRAGLFDYVGEMSLSAPTDDLRRMVAEAAVAKGMTQRVKNFEVGGKSRQRCFLQKKKNHHSHTCMDKGG